MIYKVQHSKSSLEKIEDFIVKIRFKKGQRGLRVKFF